MQTKNPFFFCVVDSQQVRTVIFSSASSFPESTTEKMGWGDIEAIIVGGVVILAVC